MNFQHIEPGTIHISVESLGKRFNREWIFRDMTHTFQQGKVYAITGPNGSGKSTLMQVLWGQMPPSKGTINYVVGNQKLPDAEIYQKVSIATPYMDLIEELTLTEHLEFHFKTKPVKAGFSTHQILEAMYLQDSKDKLISNFSSGMKQRVKLGLAFFSDTPVIFLDEPGTNLDHKAYDWYIENLNQLTNRLVFIASNQKDEYPEKAELIDILSYKYHYSPKT